MNAVGGRERTGDGWTIVVPVKSLDRAKSRLGSTLSPDSRRGLVVAMTTDVVTACLHSQQVGRVRIVSSDPEIAVLADRLGTEFVAETPPDPGTDVDPLNAALTEALAGLTGRVAVVAADLPELDAQSLTRVLDSAAGHPHSVVVDHRGEGTTMAFWAGGAARVCRFGPRSAERYRIEGGATVLDLDDTARGAASRDVDIPEDVVRLAGRRVGAATARALPGVSPPLDCRDHPRSATMVW
ncbi:2-phospho-L-lactate guanylyltransferase [Dietzia aurantiaca]|uniref:2-phospho-L-lactate guanylyltransferase n=1 Tax=Dietzia aurantiaca TaxID=983873 RepID=UPI001E544044|nr:2-phospho-L-lactate guanylyltransferase [Dietzia aurantiaca]MCD2261630.1 2-phospho-L-lactate guanylyltransferase [Dietzia aurantiaca]